MKKMLALFAALPVILGGCTTKKTAENQGRVENQIDGKNSIVVYFSATGTTRGVAKKIASVAESDLYEIVPADPYTDADLDWNDSNSRSTREQNDDSARPALGGEEIDLASYDTVYLGYPIWWGQAPKIMYTFVEAHSLNGKTVRPFITSGGSGVGSSATNLAKASDGGDWKDGIRFRSSVSDEDIRKWLAR